MTDKAHLATDSSCQMVIEESDVTRVCAEEGWKAHIVAYPWHSLPHMTILCEYHSARQTTEHLQFLEICELEE